MKKDKIHRVVGVAGGTVAGGLRQRVEEGRGCCRAYGAGYKGLGGGGGVGSLVFCTFMEYECLRGCRLFFLVLIIQAVYNCVKFNSGYACKRLCM